MIKKQNRNNLTKEVQNLYTKNYKPLLREIKDINKQEIFQIHEVGRFNIVTMIIFAKLIYSFNAMLTQISGVF